MPTSEFLLISCQWFTSLLAARASQLPALCGWLLSRPCNVLALRMQQRDRTAFPYNTRTRTRARNICVLNRGLYEITRLESRLMVAQRTLTSPQRTFASTRTRARNCHRTMQSPWWHTPASITNGPVFQEQCAHAREVFRTQEPD
jgi:hypothetical protein